MGKRPSSSGSYGNRGLDFLRVMINRPSGADAVWSLLAWVATPYIASSPLVYQENLIYSFSGKIPS
jgi:hypothetical protein